MPETLGDGVGVTVTDCVCVMLSAESPIEIDDGTVMAE